MQKYVKKKQIKKIAKLQLQLWIVDVVIIFKKFSSHVEINCEDFF